MDAPRDVKESGSAEPGRLAVEEIVRGPLTIRFRPVVEARRVGGLTVRTFATPLNGGTCLLTSGTRQPMRERCQKAALELGRWQRYHADVMAYAGVEDDAIAELVNLLGES